MDLSAGVLAHGHSPRLFNRDLSWLAFHRRLLYEVADTDQPVWARVIKLARASTALDEYFMVRIPLLKTGAPDTSVPHACTLQSIHARVSSLVARQQAHFHASLSPQLVQRGLHL